MSIHQFHPLSSEGREAPDSPLSRHISHTRRRMRRGTGRGNTLKEDVSDLEGHSNSARNSFRKVLEILKNAGEE